MKTYIIRDGQKVYFNNILTEKKRFYFGCGMQNGKDTNALFLHIGCSLFTVFNLDGKMVYNAFNSENGKENYQIDFKNVELL